MECNKKVKDKIVMCKFVDVPTNVLVKSTQFNSFAIPTLTNGGKGKRNSS